ncbi:MAG: glycosyltransferase [Acidobacteriota bacterium]
MSAARARVAPAGSVLAVWHLLVGLTRGGAERLVADVLPHLGEHGMRPQVLVLKGWGPMGREFRQADIPVEVLGGRGSGDPRPVVKLLARLRRERPALLHAHLTRAVLAGGWAARWARIPLIVHFHSLAGERPFWHDRFEGAITRQAVARVAVSEAVAADRAGRLHLPRHDFQVVPNGIAMQRFLEVPAPDSAAGRPLVAGFLGRLLVREKGLDVLLDAAARLRDDPHAGRRIHFEIAGGPEAMAAVLRGEIQRRGLGGRVALLGEVPDPVSALARWDLAVLPSRSEGFGLVLVEAMAAGRPVVASRTGGIPEVVQDSPGGVLVPPGDSRALARALADLAGAPETLGAMGRAAREHVRERFDAVHTARGWARLARRSLGGGGKT